MIPALSSPRRRWPLRAAALLVSVSAALSGAEPAWRKSHDLTVYADADGRKAGVWLSRDEGGTWTPAHDIGVRGYPSHLLRRRDDSLVMTYGYRAKPHGVRARISRDHGRSWGQERVLTADGATEDLGYPTTVELANGALLRQARWR